MKRNYHTHTRLCTHAVGDVEDYVKAAIELGFTHLGLSDHGPLVNAGFPRMSLSEFTDIYLKDIAYCKNKYKEIKLYAGVEIEYFYGRDEYYRTLRDHLDYMVLGCHYYSGYTHERTSGYDIRTKEELFQYVTLVEDALDTGLFKILAHPDFFLCGYSAYDENFELAVKRICEACIRNHVYLECNAAGFTKGKKDFEGISDYRYPNTRFFTEVKKYPSVQVVVNSDCHNPAELLKNIDKAYQLLEEVGITPVENIME